MHEQIISYLSPLLGEATAKNLLKHYCIKMKIASEEISSVNLPEFADAMRPMMAVWLGSSTYRDAIAFVVLILILLFKPEGIMGKGLVEKV